MVKAFNMAGNTCYGTAENFDALKPELDKLHQQDASYSNSPILIYEQDEDTLKRPLFQKIRIAKYNDGWEVKL